MKIQFLFFLIIIFTSCKDKIYNIEGVWENDLNDIYVFKKNKEILKIYTQKYPILEEGRWMRAKSENDTINILIKIDKIKTNSFDAKKINGLRELKFIPISDEKIKVLNRDFGFLERIK